MVKSRCSTCGEWFDDDELDEHLIRHDEAEGLVPEPRRLKCLDCQIDMDAYYGVPFKVGQSDPAARLLLGWVSELGEEPMLLDLYVCPQCGRLQQFVNQKTRDRLKRSVRK